MILFYVRFEKIKIKINSVSIGCRFNLVNYGGPGVRIEDLLGPKLSIDLLSPDNSYLGRLINN